MAAPIITAQEAAGDLWLQVHRFEDARRAYLSAAEQVGATRRVTLGLARTAFRLGDLPASCAQYRALVTGWPQKAGEPPELMEQGVPSTAGMPRGSGAAATVVNMYRFRAEVLEQLEKHGVRPTATTRPELVHEFVSDLYRDQLPAGCATASFAERFLRSDTSIASSHCAVSIRSYR